MLLLGSNLGVESIIDLVSAKKSYLAIRAGLKPIGPIAPNWTPRPILQTLVQIDWEPGPTEIVPNLAPHLIRPALLAIIQPFTPTVKL